MMQLMREKAHEIRGIEPARLDVPKPPKLLPIERMSAISWQGSAGADTYNVWRAEERGRDNPVRRGYSTVYNSRGTATDKIVRPACARREPGQFAVATDRALTLPPIMYD